ncbi:MAG: biopolymer transporter ExbD [Bacteroidota bacterium]
MPARRLAASIPTASMSDIAFLMLVFFLVATAIRDDAGIPTVLPPAGATGTASVPALLDVRVSARGEILVGDRVLGPEAARAEVAAFATEAADPRVALQAHRATPYAAYIAALDAVLMGHRDADAAPRLTLREPQAAPLVR